MADWGRVPFTCSYIPGKGFVPQMCVKAFATYMTFTLATGLLIRAHFAIRPSRWWRLRSSASPPRRYACAEPVMPGRPDCCSRNNCRPM